MPVEVPLPWERLLWSGRAVWPPGARYALTDFRLVRVNGRRSAEIALDDIGEVRCGRSWLDRLLGTSTVAVHARDSRRPPLVLRTSAAARQLAALLDLAAGDPHASLDPDSARAALSWEPPVTASRPQGDGRRRRRRRRWRRGARRPRPHSPPAIAYPADDAIYPEGRKKSREAIVAFMETAVMPWARAALAPIVGGADQSPLRDVPRREMPENATGRCRRSRRCPSRDVQIRGWEQYSGGMDAQMRNAIYGYVAESDKQAKAAYMREVVMPGMARLLHRPAYDFTPHVRLQPLARGVRLLPLPSGEMTLARRLVPPCVLGLLVCPLVGRAQNSVATPDGVVTALRLGPGDVIRLDGVPDEAVWKRAAVATGFLQREPDNGAPATESTEVRLVYDADRLILGVTLYDSEPERILGNQMQRDQSFAADDRFMWTIDSFLDGRSGYYFEINPSGAMGDALVDPGLRATGRDYLGSGINRSWDGVWLARVGRTAAGWTAEIEIPFRTLNFDRTASAWGINFQRTVRRKSENSLWTGHALNQGLARMSNAGRVEGLEGISQGLGLDLKPYVVGSVSSEPGLGQPSAHPTGDVGIDAFYSLTPALRANLSVNTDFAETEVDVRRVNLTRFPLFFEEKRDFFLEGSSFFDFAREPDESVIPFFSRRIGLDDSGVPQRIVFGAKLTGEAGGFDVGVLQVRTGEEERTVESGALAGEDFSVFRLRRRAFQQSYFGSLYTRRSARAPGSTARHTAGLDFQLQTSTFRRDRNLDFSGFYVWTSTPFDTGDSAAYGLRATYPNDPISLAISVREIQPQYDPAVGFVERRGYRRVNPRADYTPRLRNNPWIQGFRFRTDLSVLADPENRLLDARTPGETDRGCLSG